MSKKEFVWREIEGDEYNLGGDATDILVQHYGDPGMRTMLLTKDEFENLKPWRLCALLNSAYEAGRSDSMEALRHFIGIK